MIEQGMCNSCYTPIYRETVWRFKHTGFPVAVSVQELKDPIPINYERIQEHIYTAYGYGDPITHCPGCLSRIVEVSP